MKKIICIELLLVSIASISACGTMTSLRSNQLFSYVPRERLAEISSVFKEAGFTPKLPTYYPYKIIDMNANEGPGKTNPSTKIQNISIYFNAQNHLLEEDVVSAKASSSVFSGIALKLSNGNTAYFQKESNFSILELNGQDGYFYKLLSYTPSKDKNSNSKPDLDELNMVKVANSLK